MSMKIVYMGTPDFAVSPLLAIHKAGYEVPFAVTQEDKPGGRGNVMKPPAVKTAALSAGIPVLQPKRMKDPEFLQKLREADADYFVVAAFGRILPAEVLKIPKKGCVNIHASLLPSYRGAAPIQHAILDGKTKTGITTMLMDEGLDTGDILCRYPVEISPEETGGSLFDRLTSLGAEAILDTLQKLEAGSIVPVPQGETDTPYARMLTKEDGALDFSRPAEELERQVRGLYPWPGTYGFLKGKMLKILSCRIPEEEIRWSEGTVPGQLLAEQGERLFIRCGSGTLEVLELQQEGKKRMPVPDWLRGARIGEDAVLSGKR